MPLTEIVLTTVAERTFNYALDQGQSIIEDWVRKMLGLEPKQQAFKRALNKAYKRFEKQYPQWASDLFNASFLENEGAPILAQFLIRDGHPDPSELATCWADSLNIRNPERRTTLVRELEPAATDFLGDLAQELKKEPELSELNDSRAFEQLASDLKAIRHKLDAEQATPGTRRDYLHWLIERNLYLDPRGTFQTQRQVQVRLDEVYISLRAQRDKAPGEVDRRLLEHEMAQLEAKIAHSNLRAEEIEDQREHLLARIESRLADSIVVAGEVLELAEVVKRHDHLVILGDPGSGKSTLLRYLALKHAQALYDGRSEAGSDLGAVCFPILIRIADYAEHGMPEGKSLSEYLVDYYRMHECPKFGLADLLASELAGGNCSVLLDGLDEIVNADGRRKVVERIEDFIHYHDNRSNRFIITSRIAGYRSAPLGDPFVHYNVQEMDEVQIRRFLERWCSAVEAAQTPDLSPEARDAVARREIDAITKAVQTSPGVHRLAANPLLLRTLALIHRTGAQLPQKRIELYKLAADTLARTWRTAQGVPESALVDDKYLTRLLGKLAYWLHANKSTGIATEQEVYGELGQEWARIKGLTWEEDNPDIESEVKKFLQAVREHTGLFVERAPKRYGFMHLTFEEYYAARFLVARSKGRAKLIRQHLHTPRWEEPILLALGFVGLDSPEDAADLLETAILAEGEEAEALGFTHDKYEELLGRDYLFALHCLGDNIPARPKFIQPLVKRLADELLHQTGSARFQRYRQALNKRLEYLKGSEGASLLLPLLVAALDDTNLYVRQRAAESLVRLGETSDQVKSALFSVLENADSMVRIQTAKRLIRPDQAYDEVVTVILNALRDDDSEVSSVAADGLEQLGEVYDKVLTVLLNDLCNDDHKVRYRAISAFKYLVLKDASHKIVPALLNALDDSNHEVRFEAALSFRFLRQEQVSQEVLAALLNAMDDENSWVRCAAAESLGALKQVSDKVVITLLNALRDIDPAIRLEAASGLVFLRQIRHIVGNMETMLLEALHDENSSVRSLVARNLGALSHASSEVVPTLLIVLRYGELRMRSAAANSLGRLEQASSEVISALLDALYDEEPEVGYQAADSLRRLGQISEEVVAVLFEALHKAESWVVRLNSARLLGQISRSDESAVQALWRGLIDKNYYVCTASAQALAQIGHRFPAAAETIERKFVQAIEDPEFDKLDIISKRSGRDYAYDGLWLSVVGDEIEND